MIMLFITVLAVVLFFCIQKGNGTASITRKTVYTTPTGQIYSLFSDMLGQHHLLIAGCQGSGKSVAINGLIATLLYRFPFDRSGGAQMVLIDTS